MTAGSGCCRTWRPRTRSWWRWRPGRSWFRYHQLFATLLQQQLRCTEPDQVVALHQAAAGWLAGHGYPVEAIRHAQSAQDWDLAARLLADH